MKCELICCLILFFTSSCIKKAPQSEIDIPVISFKEEAPIFDSEDIECRFIPLQTTTDNMIGDISQIEIKDDRIFIMDMSMGTDVFVYDINGASIGTVGNVGNGPGEYSRPFSLRFDKTGKYVIVVDTNLQKLFYYDRNSFKFIKTVSMPGYCDCEFLENGDLAFYAAASFPSDKRDFYYLKISDSEVNNIRDFYPAEFKSHDIAYSGSNFHKGEDALFVHSNYSPLVWKVSDNEVKPVYKLDVSPVSFPPLDWLNAEAAGDRFYTPVLFSSGYVFSYSLHETSEYLCIRYIAGKQFYIGLYNKKSKKAYSYHFPDFMRKAAIEGGQMKIVGVYKDYFITYLLPVTLKKHSIQRPDLRTLAEQVSEEDNPILCLFKFK